MGRAGSLSFVLLGIFMLASSVAGHKLPPVPKITLNLRNSYIAERIFNMTAWVVWKREEARARPILPDLIEPSRNKTTARTKPKKEKSALESGLEKVRLGMAEWKPREYRMGDSLDNYFNGKLP